MNRALMGVINDAPTGDCDTDPAPSALRQRRGRYLTHRTVAMDGTQYEQRQIAGCTVMVCSGPVNQPAPGGHLTVGCIVTHQGLGPVIIVALGGVAGLEKSLRGAGLRIFESSVGGAWGWLVPERTVEQVLDVLRTALWTIPVRSRSQAA